MISEREGEREVARERERESESKTARERDRERRLFVQSEAN